jgi:hypothetical protein
MEFTTVIVHMYFEGVRFDWDGEVVGNDGTDNKFPNPTKSWIDPSTFKDWGDKRWGTRAVMASAIVKKGAMKDDARAALEDAAAAAVRAGMIVWERRFGRIGRINWIRMVPGGVTAHRDRY